ncbi:MAG: MFS transporter [Thermoplasmataceae archaeon]
MFRTLTSKQKKTLNVISIIEFFRMLGIFLVIPIIAVFSTDFTHSGLLIGVSVAAYEISMAIFQVPFGKLSDKIGRKNAIIIGLIPFIIGNVLTFYSTNIFILIGSRFLAGSGAISTPAIAWAQETTGKENKNISMSYIGASIGISFLVGTSFSPEISSIFGLRAIFLISAITGILSIILAISLNDIRIQKEGVVYQENKHQITFHILLISFIGLLVSVSSFMIFYLIQIYSFDRYGLSGYSYILFLPVIVGGIIAVFFTERLRILKKELKKEISFFLLGIGIAVIFTIYLVNISGFEMSLLLIPFFTGYGFYELLMIPYLTNRLKTTDYGIGIGMFYSLQFLGSGIGAVIAGVIMGPLSGNFLIFLSLSLSLIVLAIAGIISYLSSKSNFADLSF